MRLQQAWLVVVVAVVACSAPDHSAPTTVAAESPTSLAPVEETAPPVDDPAALCNGYLVLLRTGDDGPLRDALEEDSEMTSDLDAMLSTEGEFEAIAAAAFRLEAALVERCEVRFNAGVEPAPDDEAALTAFFEALVDGDETAGAKVARANVVAQFSPWSPIDDRPAYSVEGSAGSLVLTPSVGVACRAAGGVVVSCVFEE